MKKLFMQLSNTKINRFGFPEKKFLPSLYDRVSLNKNRLEENIFLAYRIDCLCIWLQE
jgi:hypothetical protein